MKSKNACQRAIEIQKLRSEILRLVDEQQAVRFRASFSLMPTVEADQYMERRQTLERLVKEVVALTSAKSARGRE